MILKTRIMTPSTVYQNELTPAAAVVGAGCIGMIVGTHSWLDAREVLLESVVPSRESIFAEANRSRLP